MEVTMLIEIRKEQENALHRNAVQESECSSVTLIGSDAGLHA